MDAVSYGDLKYKQPHDNDEQDDYRTDVIKDHHAEHYTVPPPFEPEPEPLQQQDQPPEPTQAALNPAVTIYNGLFGERFPREKIPAKDIAVYVFTWGLIESFLFALHVNIYLENYDTIFLALPYAALSVILPYVLFSFLALHKFGKNAWQHFAFALGVLFYCGGITMEILNFKSWVYDLSIGDKIYILEGELLTKAIEQAELLALVSCIALTGTTMVFSALAAFKHANLISYPATTEKE